MNILDLAGMWQFQLDPQDVGLAEHWFNRPLDQTIRLPGSLQAQGYGHDITVDTEWIGNIVDRSWFTEERYARYREPGAIKVPFWLQPDKHYNGVAWYQREVTIPAEWQAQRVTLTLERPHWETRVWWDDRDLGSKDSLSVPHVYDLGCDITPGTHRVTVRVNNSILVDVGPNSHSVSDHTQTNWNGVVGRIELAASSPVWMSDIQVYPNVTHKTATVMVKLANALGKSGHGKLALHAKLYNSPDQHEPLSALIDMDIAADGGPVEVNYVLGEGAQAWDEFNPALYALKVELEADVDGHCVADQRLVTFGLREIGVLGTQLAINSRKLFIRGTLECCIFPLTGYPPTDVDAWKRIIRVAKSHGLNQLRFHSWCPPEAAFIAGDELGFYFQIECASWANQGASIGEGKPLDRWLYEEGHRITQAYGNHPSFIMMAYGNEPAGNLHEYLGPWVTYWRQHDPRHVYTSAAGWPAIPENQYHNIPGPRIQVWGAELGSRINALPPETCTDYRQVVEQMNTPIVSHEIGQWCAYPNFDEIEKYVGFLKARNFEIFRESLQAHGLGDQAHEFLMASGKLQTLCYKEDIESALRTPGFAGFNLLDLHDFPGQGSALVGVLDPFWESKGYVTPGEYSRFCNSTVPLARLSKRTWHTNERLTADVDIAHFGPAPLLNAVTYWKLVEEQGSAVAQGILAPATIPIGNDFRLGTLIVELKNLAPARKYKLVVGIEGTRFENDWDLWVFADKLDTTVPDDVLITLALDDTALERLAAGGKVLLMLRAETVNAQSQIGFSSVFWNTAWTRGQAPHTLGILCDPQHPALAEFPTDYHSNWQWWELIHGSAAMPLDHLPTGLRPLVQPIDTWFENRKLGLLFEAKVNGGKLMVCSMNLQSDLDQRLVARQMRFSLLCYMHSEQFNPTIAVDLPGIQSLVKSAAAIEFDKSARLTIGSPLRVLLSDASSRAVLEKYLAPYLQTPEIQTVLDLSLEKVASHAPAILTRELLKIINDDLAKGAHDPHLSD